MSSHVAIAVHLVLVVIACVKKLIPLSIKHNIIRYTCVWGFESVNQRSSNNQWINSLADMFRDLFLSSVPGRMSNLDITN